MSIMPRTWICLLGGVVAYVSDQGDKRPEKPTDIQSVVLTTDVFLPPLFFTMKKKEGN